MFEKMKNAMYRFMYGRYGVDQLYKFSFGVFIVLIFARLFIKNSTASMIVLVLQWALMVWMFFRAFSKNHYKRRAENDVYLKVTRPIREFIRLQKNRIHDRKTHVYRKCPKCHAVVRLPKKKGKHTVGCPKCKNDFKVRI